MIQQAGERTTRVAGDVAALPSPEASPVAQVESAEVRVSLARAREVLPEPESKVICLHYDVGMSLSKIAEDLGMSLSRVTHLHARGVARLRARMNEDPASRAAGAAGVREDDEGAEPSAPDSRRRRRAVSATPPTALRK